MNTEQLQQLKKMQARAARIREFRQEVISRRVQQPRVIASRMVFEDGRLTTRLLIDGSAQLGRGNSYWLSPAKHNQAA